VVSVELPLRSPAHCSSDCAFDCSFAGFLVRPFVRATPSLAPVRPRLLACLTVRQSVRPAASPLVPIGLRHTLVRAGLHVHPSFICMSASPPLSYSFALDLVSTCQFDRQSACQFVRESAGSVIRLSVRPARQSARRSVRPPTCSPTCLSAHTFVSYPHTFVRSSLSLHWSPSFVTLLPSAPMATKVSSIIFAINVPRHWCRINLRIFESTVR